MMQRSKKWLSAVLTAGLLIGAVPNVAFAADYVQSAAYTIERHDFSWYDNGQLKLLYYYDQVVLDENTANTHNLNIALQQHYNDFYLEVPANLSFAQEMPPYAEGQYYRYYYEPKVFKNQDGVISLGMDWYWNFGGVNDYGIDGFNYDLNTGKKLDLTEIFSLSKAQIEQYFKQQTYNYMAAHPDYSWWNDRIQNAWTIVGNYQLDEYNYYIEGNNVVIVYPKYELGPGYMGAIKVSCPIINNTIDVTLDGNALTFDQQPIMDNNRVMVPIRAIFEALGYTVDWDQVTQTGTATNGDNTITVQVNNAGITYDGGTYWCDVAPKNVSGRILVPIRAISESAGCDVYWNQTMKKVIIETN